MEWVSKERLARDCRPGYDNQKVPPAILKESCDKWNAAGIKSIICLLAERYFKCYTGIIRNLLDEYRQAGFQVEHVPIEDIKHPPLDDSELESITSAYENLHKPILVHCNNGVEQTGAAIKHLMAREFDALSRKYSYVRGIGHFDQVTCLALEIYDVLKPIHRLCPDDRKILEFAAMLHDIGTAADKFEGLPHAWAGAELILDQFSVGNCPYDIQRIAMLVSLSGTDEDLQVPDAVSAESKFALEIGPLYKKVYEGDLKLNLDRKMAILAGILRVADGYDYSQAQTTYEISLSDNILIAGTANDTDRIKAQNNAGLLCACLPVKVEG